MLVFIYNFARNIMIMRRKDREITGHDEIMKVMAQCDTCRLALNDSATGYPYILPLNFGYTEDEDSTVTLYFHGATQGYKYDVIGRDPRATFEMDCNHRLVSSEEKGNCTMEYQSIIGHGRLTTVEDYDEKVKALTILTDNYHEQHFEFSKAAVGRTTVMALKVEGMTAKQRIVKE